MNWLDKLERKLGRFAIPNLTVYLLVGYVIGFGIMYLMPEAYFVGSDPSFD